MQKKEENFDVVKRISILMAFDKKKNYSRGKFFSFIFFAYTFLKQFVIKSIEKYIIQVMSAKNDILFSLDHLFLAN
jgi:hypothetical protein